VAAGRRHDCRGTAAFLLDYKIHGASLFVTHPPIGPLGAPLILIEGLIKQFGRFAALRGVSAEFAAGKFYVILGDNGAGKTTLLRALAGLAQPTRGTVSILGKSPQEACREIGYMAHPSLL
jgi:ABC-type molybdenum transport system ATPase subunit/photorepair protein PhrA